MQIIVIDNTTRHPIVDRCQYLGYNFTPILIPTDNDLSAYAIADHINQHVIEEDVILLLNAKLRYHPDSHPWYGVEVLKEIRANAMLSQKSRIQDCHIVLFSPLSLVRFINIDSRDFFIAISPRVTYRRYTDDLATLNLKQLCKQKLTDLSVLLPHFHASSLFNKNRHRPTNLWAATQFFRQYQRLYPGAVDTYLKHLNRNKTPLFRDASFIYSLSSPSWNEKQGAALRKKLSSLRQRLYREDDFGMRQAKQIVLIDDQAEQLNTRSPFGWKEVYSLLFFGRSEGLRTISAQQSNEQILAQIDYSIDCILLDLHFDAHDQQVHSRKVRGAVLMQQIQDRYPFLPVIITTASNKARKRKILRDIGCDGYWIKEGIDEPLDHLPSFQNYLDLLELVGKITSHKYSFLRSSAQRIQRFMSQQMWWENYTWPGSAEASPRKINISKHYITNLLEHALLIARNYLQPQFLGEGFYPNKKNGMELRGLIVQLALVLEAFHSPRGGFSGRLLYQHQDERGKELYRRRNQAAHRTKKSSISYQDFCDFFNRLLDYLETSPAEPAAAGVTKDNSR